MDLFDHAGLSSAPRRRESLGPGAVLLRGLALPDAGAVLGEIRDVAAESPFRHMITPGGFRMSVAMTSCGDLGWVTDRGGYRYQREDPASRRPWPTMPPRFLHLARSAAAEAGFEDFTPDSCLINRYEPGARMTLHQDKNEQDFRQPIVSVSLGLAAVFVFGGEERTDPQTRFRLEHGDVVVWGGPARLRYHGVLPLNDGVHPLVGGHRLNLTFRKAG